MTMTMNMIFKKIENEEKETFRKKMNLKKKLKEKKKKVDKSISDLSFIL